MSSLIHMGEKVARSGGPPAARSEASTGVGNLPSFGGSRSDRETNEPQEFAVRIRKISS